MLTGLSLTNPVMEVETKGLVVLPLDWACRHREMGNLVIPSDYLRRGAPTTLAVFDRLMKTRWFSNDIEYVLFDLKGDVVNEIIRQDDDFIFRLDGKPRVFIPRDEFYDDEFRFMIEDAETERQYNDTMLRLLGRRNRLALKSMTPYADSLK